MSFLWAAALYLLASSAQPAVPVTDIVISTDRTEHEVIRRELSTRLGDPYSAERVRADMQRLKNFGVFWSVDATAVTQPTGTRLHINIRDKWTLLPRFRFATADNVLDLQVGLYDANLLGTYTEVGAQIEQKAGAYGFLVWNYNWSLRYTDYYYKLDAGLKRIFRYVYNQNSPGDALEGVYASNDSNARLEFGQRINGSSDHLVGVVFHPGYVNYNASTATQAHRQINADTGFRAPRSRRYFRTGLHLQWDRPSEDDYIFDGSGVDAYVLTRFGGLTDLESVRASFEYKWLASIFNRHNVGFRVFAGRTNSILHEDAFTMGGLFEVRGFPDERFFGQNIWFANTEYRFPLIDGSYLHVQPTLFADAGKAWNGSMIGNETVSNLALTGGVGIRMRIKPMFNTALRVDYGWAVRPFRDEALSLGITQFF